MTNSTLLSTTEEDLPLINRWITADPWHSTEVKNSAEWLTTGNGLLTFCLADDKGPLCFMRLDAEGDMVRAAIQFAPESEVSRKRLVIGLARLAFPAIIKFSKERGFKGIVFESVSPALIEFTKKKYGVVKAAAENDYALTFEEQNYV